MIIYHPPAGRVLGAGAVLKVRSVRFPSLFLFLTIAFRPFAKIARGENISGTNMPPFVRKPQGGRENRPARSQPLLPGASAAPGGALAHCITHVGKLRTSRVSTCPRSRRGEAPEPRERAPPKRRPGCRRAPGSREQGVRAARVQTPDLPKSQDVDTVFAALSGD